MLPSFQTIYQDAHDAFDKIKATLFDNASAHALVDAARANLDAHKGAVINIAAEDAAREVEFILTSLVGAEDARSIASKVQALVVEDANILLTHVEDALDPPAAQPAPLANPPTGFEPPATPPFEPAPPVVPVNNPNGADDLATSGALDTPPAEPPTEPVDPTTDAIQEPGSTFGMNVDLIPDTATVGEIFPPADQLDAKVHVSGGEGEISVSIVQSQGDEDPGLATAGLQILGTPTIAQTLVFDITATDQATPPNVRTATKTIVVNPAA